MLSDRMTTDIAATALSHRCVAGNAIFHSDRSSQYATGRSLSGRAPNDRVPSCSRTGNCHGSTMSESLFATLKNEMHYRASFATRAANHAVIELIKADCNRRRPPRPSVTRCPRMPCSRSSSTRSLNRSRFPLPSSSSSSMSENLTQITLTFLALPLCRLLKIAPLL